MNQQSPTRFIILGTQRSGTTLVASTLRAYPSITQVGEVFVRERDHPVTYRSFVERNLNSRILHYLWRRRTIYAYLDHFFASHQTQAVGFKFMYAQSRWLPYRYPQVISYLEDCHPRIIHVYRRNLLKSRISAAVARHNDLFHAVAGDKRQIAPVTVNPAKIIRQMQRMEKERRRWRKWLTRHDHIEVAYEDFVIDRDKWIADMLNFLSIDDKEIRYSKLRKVSPKKLSNIVENYDELCRSLVGTPYEKHLDDD